MNFTREKWSDFNATRLRLRDRASSFHLLSAFLELPASLHSEHSLHNSNAILLSPSRSVATDHGALN